MGGRDVIFFAGCPTPVAGAPLQPTRRAINSSCPCMVEQNDHHSMYDVETTATVLKLFRLHKLVRFRLCPMSFSLQLI